LINKSFSKTGVPRRTPNSRGDAADEARIDVILMYHRCDFLNLGLGQAINVGLLVFLDELSAKVIWANVDLSQFQNEIGIHHGKHKKSR
jgi:hypothetical protein